MSGGQMQRVAIARALVNNPDILLADEPTGALDSETSLQIMELLKEISREKLVIMVTHNPELAEHYSTRIINLLDGQVISDSNPYTAPVENEAEKTETPVQDNADTQEKKENKKNKKVNGSKERKTSMSFLTALFLSLNNLLTKKGRTFLTSFAGSIGIIGIALILSVSSGVNAYINSVEESTMSSYPLQINESTMDTMSMLSALMKDNSVESPEPDKVYSNDVMANVMNSVTAGATTNNLSKFMKFIESDKDFKANTTDIKYKYSARLNTYMIQEGNIAEPYKQTLNGLAGLFETIGLGAMMGMDSSSSSMMGNNAFSELVGDSEYIQDQYKLLHGNYPTEKNHVLLIVDSKQQISDFILYTLGIRNTQDLENYITSRLNDNPDDDYVIPAKSYTFDEICGYKFKVLPESEKYTVNKLGQIVERSKEEINDYLKSPDSLTLEIVGIVTPNDSNSNVIGSIAYTSELMKDIIELSNSGDVAKLQLENTTTDLMTGLPFAGFSPDCSFIRYFVANMMPEYQEFVMYMSDYQILDTLKDFLIDEPSLNMLLKFQFEGGIAPYGGYTAAHVENIIRPMLTPAEGESLTGVQSLAKQLLDNSSPDNFARIINTMLMKNANYTPAQAHTYALRDVGYVDFTQPTSILIYPKDFDSKEVIKAKIDAYNDEQVKEDKITYTDTVALLMSSVTTIIDAISYVLIAFVAISLVVSSIMIGIITYISVLERTKEIGILRAIGASKRDVSRVFSAETLIVGFAAGVIGILVSLVLIVVINIILVGLTGLPELKAVLPVGAAFILVGISMGLTLIAGIFPSNVAANKDPVIALRTE
ncbi:MAG: FtsX-like permease family protein [Clostridia bacterium]|nr:FtsX-like permease family protein [Clostridia bacterium]